MQPIYITGVRSYEKIVAAVGSKSNVGSELIVRGNYPPSRTAVEGLTETELGALYAVMRPADTIDTFRHWLLDQSTEAPNLYLNDIDDLYVKVISLSGTLFDEKMSEDDRTKFGNDNPNDPKGEGFWPLSEIYQAIAPNKEGSRARHHTLVFRPSVWTLEVDDSNKRAKGKVDMFDLASGEIKTCKGDYIYVEALGVAVKIHKVDNITPLGLYTLISELLSIKVKKLQRIASLLETWATPAVYKSLIQKIIRTGAPIVTHNAKEYNSDAVLLVAYALLLIHPGVYVPDLHCFVSGQESAMKRLAISICEDSYLDQEELNEKECSFGNSGAALASLFVGALVSKENRNKWKPSLKIVKAHMKLALIARSSINQFQYSTKSFKGGNAKTDAYSIAINALIELKSFETDINMVSWIAHLRGASKGTSLDVPEELNTSGIATMPLVHCLDHHVYPEFVYYVDYSVLHKYGPESDFGDFFRDVWKLCSSVNCRKGALWDEENEVVNEIRRAQDLLWRVKQGTQSVENIVKFIDEVEKVEFELPDDWIAGLVGPIEIHLRKRKYLVSIDPLDILERKVMKRVNGDEDVNISEKDRAEAILQFNGILEEGVKPKKLAILKLYAISKIYWTEGKYYVNIRGKKLQWHKGKLCKLEVPVFEELEKENMNYQLTSLFISNINGIEKNAFDKLNDLLSAYTSGALQRLLAVILTCSGRIELPNINRKGKGTKYAVKIIDVKVFELLCRLVCLFPFAISRSSSRTFEVSFPPFLDMLKDSIQGNLSERTDEYKRWSRRKALIIDKDNRTLMPHQAEIVERMIGNDKHSYIIDSPKGSGKTLTVCEYMRRLDELGKLPPYVVYTLPKGAFKEVKRELRKCNININVIDPRNGADFTFNRYCANLIAHDHLKRKEVVEVIRPIVPDMLLIVDEFHYALNKTIRTTAILELARNCYLCVAMSGTTILNTDITLNIPWLSQLVHFEVNKENVQVAMGAMLSKRVDIGVKVKHKERSVDITDAKLETEYLRLVKNRYSDDKKRMDPADFTKAVRICYSVCAIEKVELCLRYLAEGVMLVAGNKVEQYNLYKMLLEKGLNPDEVYLLTSDAPISLHHDDPRPIKVVIVTVQHNTGYSLTKLSVMITSVYFTNQAVREQLEGRIARLGQPRSKVLVITVHTGLLSEIHERYKEAKNMSMAVKSLAEEIGLGGSVVTGALRGE